MMDLIVLGVVPGTHFIITLWWAVAFSIIFLLVVLIYVEMSRTPKNTKRSYPAVDLDSIHVGSILPLTFVLPGRSSYMTNKFKD